MKNQKPKAMSIHIYTKYNNGSFVINFIKLLMHYIFSFFSFFLYFFYFFYMQFLLYSTFHLLEPLSFQFNLAFSLVIKKKKKTFIRFPLDFKFFFLYIFLNSTVSLYSTFHLLTSFLFHLNFHINFFLFHFHLSPLFLLSFPLQKGQYSLSLFLPSCFSFDGFFLLFQQLFFLLLMVLFVIVDLIVISHLFFFFGKFVSTFMHIQVVWYFNFHKFFFLIPLV